MKTYKQLLFVGLLLVSVSLTSGCKKDDDPTTEPVLTETERLLTTKNWQFDRTINYGAFDMQTDVILAGQDTTETTRANRHMTFNMEGKAFYKDTAADTTVVEYLYSLNEDQTEMRVWEQASTAFFPLYTDHDYAIIQLDENKLVWRGDQKRRSLEKGYTSYNIVRVEFTAF